MRNERMHQELLELIQTDSASRQERAIAEKLMAKLKDLGFAVIMDGAGKALNGDCGNLFAWREGEREGSLLLCSHMDRVGEGLGIVPVERDGVLRSGGTTILAADDVSGICVILEGLRRALSSGSPLPRLEVLFTVAEEAGLLGAKQVDVSQIQSRIGLFFDSAGPTGRIINGAPGMYFLGAQLTGRSAHAGNEPEKGIDAAKIMCDMLSTLRQGRLDELTTANFPILSTAAWGTNSVCDSASFRGEDQEVLRLARRACEAVGVQCLVESGGGGMDANVFNAQGISSVGVATGYYKNHTKEEYLVLEDFYRAGDLAAAMIEHYGKAD